MNAATNGEERTTMRSSNPCSTSPTPRGALRVTGQLALSLALTGVTLAVPTTAQAADGYYGMNSNGNCGTNSFSDLHPIRDQILNRSTSWLNKVNYSQSRCYRNSFGGYRTDCSGYVSLAWGLQSTTWWTGNMSARFKYLNRLEDLRPGDALWRHDSVQHHIALFVRWEGNSLVMREEYQTGTNTSERRWTRSKAADFKPVRYIHVAEDGGVDLNNPADGTLLRDVSDGSIYVIAGRAKFGFTSMAELTASGYGTNFVNVDHSVITRLPDVPGDGASVRDTNDGSIYVIAGGAKFGLANWDEVVDAKAERYVNLPHRFMANFGTEPTNGTLLHNSADGTVTVVAGGAAFDFNSPEELTASGYSWSQVTVPRRYLDALGDVPHDGTLLRDPANGTMVVMAGGAAVPFRSPEEVLESGYDWSQVNIPSRHMATLATQPRDRTLLRNLGDGSIYVVAGGAAFGFADWAEFTRSGYTAETWVHVPTAYVTGMPAATAGTLVRNTISTQVWSLSDGKRTPVSPPAGANVTMVGDQALAAIPVA